MIYPTFSKKGKMAMKINPKRTAILSLDVQNDLVKITPEVRENKVLESIARIIQAGRRKQIPIIHITASVRRDFRDIPRDNPLWIAIRQSKTLIMGTQGAKIHPKVKPLKTELVLNKSCVDPFLSTNLAQALQNADVTTLILMGLWTNYVVEATARHASDLGFRVFIVRECCASNRVENHEFAMGKILPTICYVVSLKETLEALK
jgi:nicotinamidase-related amidase